MLHGRATMAGGAKAGAAVVAGADIGLAEASSTRTIQDMRISHEAIYRSLFIQSRGVLKKELTAHLRTKRQMRLAKGGPAPNGARANPRYGLYPRAARRGRGSRHSRPLGRRSCSPGERHEHRHPRRATQPVHDACEVREEELGDRRSGRRQADRHIARSSCGAR